ncbi:MAG: Stp1/IreP family PP2C-type Ser/Thr phosphatase [Candidatus Marinimicrobia bacterium]|nr:Stp1/IreP family PP2C-type Ser/Thr phosphatase [Candidatus Neomarinimicrobiota bacterium]
MPKKNFYVLSKKGKKSPKNEDNYATPDSIDKLKLDKNGFLYLVCDGMGGHNAGEVASEFCAKGMLDKYYNYSGSGDVQKILKNIIEDVNSELYNYSKKDEERFGMGTTLVNLLIKDKFAYINNVGDSRLYLFDFDKDKFQQITEDHSEVWKLYEQKIISKEDIITHPRKNIITQAMGIDEEIKINEYKIALPKKFLFLLCSDGLTDVMTDNSILKIIKKSKNLENCANSLYELSQKNNSRDDVTILLVSNFKLQKTRK